MIKWNNPTELSSALEDLVTQQGSEMDYVFVQEWVDFDVEMRHFVVDGDAEDPSTWNPKKIVYTSFNAMSKDGNRFTSFDRFDRETCVQRCFLGDDASLQSAERQSELLIGQWLKWFQGVCSETPTVLRFDILAKRTGPGQARVTTGELTELGGCFLGWNQGPSIVFRAMVNSCMRSGNLSRVTNRERGTIKPLTRPEPY